jgi:hypothetical protein
MVMHFISHVAQMCVRAPLLGRRGVSVKSTKSGVCRSRSETMSTREGLLRPAFCTLRVKKKIRSKGSASKECRLFVGCARASGSAARGRGGEMGRPTEGMDPGERFW